MRTKICLLGFAALFVCSSQAFAETRVGKIAADDFDRLYETIKPQPGESPWREVAWVTNITEARRRAIAEDKPLIVFTAADGSPLGRT
jgi:hypothetical protein